VILDPAGTCLSQGNLQNDKPSKVVALCTVWLCEVLQYVDWRCTLALQVWLDLTDRINSARERQHLAMSTCMRCHSGGMLGPIVCENGECAVLFTRMSASNRLETLLKARERLLDW